MTLKLACIVTLILDFVSWVKVGLRHFRCATALAESVHLLLILFTFYLFLGIEDRYRLR